MDDVENRVLAFLSEFCSVDSSKILSKSSLRDDLGIEGDDAYLLLSEYSKAFCVDVSNVNLGIYFGAEEPISLFNLFSILLHERGKKAPFLVSDLVEGARSGELRPGSSWSE